MRRCNSSLLCLLIIGHSAVPAFCQQTETLGYAVSGSQSPFVRDWAGTAWGSAAALWSVGGNPRWLMLMRQPGTEVRILAVLDHTEDINVLAYDGSTWGVPTELTANTVNSANRPFCFAFEEQSGDGLFVYRTNSNDDPRFRTWNVSGWSSEQIVTTYGAGAPMWVKLVAKKNSNEILLIVLDNQKDIVAYVWNGSAFANTILLTNTAKVQNYECLDAGYEASSGDCMVAWSESASDALQYRIWSGSSWGLQQAAPDTQTNANWCRITADPSSDRLIVGLGDSDGDLNLLVWDGGNFGVALEVETSLADIDCRNFDVEFEANGTNAVAVWGKSGVNECYYRTYNGSNWSGQSKCVDLGNRVRWVQLAANGTGRVVHCGILEAGDGALVTTRWDGNGWDSPTEIAADLSTGNDVECYWLSGAPASADLTISGWREIPNPDN